MSRYTFTPTAELLAIPEAERIAWAEHLESGKYQQTKQFLYNCEGFCCLGVFEHAIGGLPLKDIEGGSLPENLEDEHPGVESFFMQTAFINISSACTFRDKEGQLSFVDMNDVYNFTFKEIAKILRGKQVTKEYDD